MYATIAELRNLQGLGDTDVYADSDLTTAAAIAKEVIDEYTGTSFGNVETPAYDAFMATVDGTGTSYIRLKNNVGRPILYVKTITEATVDAVTISGSPYKLDRIGGVRADSVAFTVGAQNVTVTGTAGLTDTPSEEIKWIARSIARNWLLNLHSRTPDRALNLTTAEGAYEVRAQAGAPGRPTAMPDVNAALNRNRHRWDV